MLAKKIERQMHGVWKHCMIRDKELERIWPINEEDREEKIAICEEIRIPSEVLSKGNVRHLRQMAAAGAQVNAMWPLRKSKDLDRGKALKLRAFPHPAGSAPGSSRRQL
jgi:hypothetical protein